MHHEAYEGFKRMLAASGWYDDTNPIHGVDPGKILGLDVGGADVNGSVRDQLPEVQWIGLDIAPAPGVQIVADAATWRLPVNNDSAFDIVIATELFEHTASWPEIIQTMALALRKDGPQILVATCASTGRAPHGARGEYGVPAGEYYGNVDPEPLREELYKYFEYVVVEYNPNPGDAYCFAKGVRAPGLRGICICGSGDADEDAQGRNPRCTAGGVPL